MQNIKNIILISIDALRFDCVGYQPDKRELEKYNVLKYLETPTLDSIAEKSLCFTQCISTSTYTTASHASIFTGLYPPRHGVRSFYGNKLSKDVFTLPEILKLFGYETVCFTDVDVTLGKFFKDRGFDHFFDADQKGLLEFLSKNNNKKLFVFVHFMDVHTPYLYNRNSIEQSSEYMEMIASLYEKYGVSGYSEAHDPKLLWKRLVSQIRKMFDHETFLPIYIKGVSSFDKGRFSAFINELRIIGLMDNSILFIFSDHGEGRISFVKPNDFGHAGDLCDSVIRTPLIVYAKGVNHAIRTEQVSLVDIFPTVLDVSVGQWKDLLPYKPEGIELLSFNNIDITRHVYSEVMRSDDIQENVPRIFMSYILRQRSLRTVSTKCIISGEPELLIDRDVIQSMNNDEFLQAVFRGLLCRFERYHEYLRLLKALNSNQKTKEEIIQDIINSDEYKSRPKYLMVDLINDPFEEHPKRIDDINANIEIFQMFDMIYALSKNPVISENVFPDDEKIIKKIIDKAIDIKMKVENKSLDMEKLEDRKKSLMNNKHIFSTLLGIFLKERKENHIVNRQKSVQQFIENSDDFAKFINERYLFFGYKSKPKESPSKVINQLRNLFSSLRKFG